MHCVAGDGLGILAGAVLSAFLLLPRPAEIAVEYILGFALGWTIFQALFMRDTAGGSYRRALTTTFLPELLSMNLLMAGMMPTVIILRRYIEFADNPATPAFWFVMSMGLLVGFIVAYPMNWWLVANHLKHGMMTVRPAAAAAGHQMAKGDMGDMAKGASAMEGMSMAGGAPPRPSIPVMTVLSFAALAAGLAVPYLLPRP
ncbi:MAG TPA: DUF4396 domain-containing protein [Xanthobacteraceae bacterium]|jgi:hypothetical protein|nr:DUF4396 domain-containing protein [Xanthobacteraceae bacterium]